MPDRYEIGFVGAGNMAEGIVDAAIARGVYRPEQVIAADPVEPRRKRFAEQFGIAVTDDNRAAVEPSRVIVLSIKPQSFAEVAAEIAGVVREDGLIISIMAGVSTAKIASAFSRIRARVVRVMPNLPIRVGAGVAGIYANEAAGDEGLGIARRLMDAGGQSIVIEDESLMDAVTAVSGSGPAYFYYVVEGLEAGGIAAGLTPEHARTLAECTCLGAAKMMLETGEEPAELRRRVTSPGGTTQAALDHLESVGVGEAFKNAVLAATRRSRELGQ